MSATTTRSALTPEDYAGTDPRDSVCQKVEAEIIMSNIVSILYRTKNEWRDLAWEEYKSEREKDGNFTESEKKYFEMVIEYAHPEKIGLFCKRYKQIWKSVQN